MSSCLQRFQNKTVSIALVLLPEKRCTMHSDWYSASWHQECSKSPVRLKIHRWRVQNQWKLGLSYPYSQQACWTEKALTGACTIKEDQKRQILDKLQINWMLLQTVEVDLCAVMLLDYHFVCSQEYCPYLWVPFHLLEIWVASVLSLQQDCPYIENWL